MTNQKPQNLFCTKHFLAVMAVFYMTTVNPAIDSFIDGNLTRKDMGKLINALVVTIIGASLKAFDKDVYTPKFLPGRNKDKALDNINELLSPTVNEVRELVLETVKDVINTANTNDVINAVIPNNTVQNDITKAVVDSTLESITSNISNNMNTDINNTLDNISDLFKTSKALEKGITIDTITNNHTTSILLISKQATTYKVEPIDSIELSKDKKIKVKAGTITYIDSYTIIASNNHISFNINDIVLYAYIPHINVIDNSITIDLSNSNKFRPTIEQCNELYSTTLTDAEYKDLINCLNTFNIDTKMDVAHLLAQIGHESAGLRYNKEIASGDDYEYREDLGNIYPGDGRKFKGK